MKTKVHFNRTVKFEQSSKASFFCDLAQKLVKQAHKQQRWSLVGNNSVALARREPIYQQKDRKKYIYNSNNLIK
jgi:hypothetical protein